MHESLSVSCLTGFSSQLNIHWGVRCLINRDLTIYVYEHSDAVCVVHCDGVRIAVLFLCIARVCIRNAYVWSCLVHIAVLHQASASVMPAQFIEEASDPDMPSLA